MECSYVFGFSLVVILLSTFSEAKPTDNVIGILPEMPKNCSNSHYCFEAHGNYPHNIVDKLLEEHNFSLLEPEDLKDLVIRAGNVLEDDCKKEIDLGPIYEIMDMNNTVRVVVQSSKKTFRQQIRVERCVNPGFLKPADTLQFNENQLKANQLKCVEKRIDYSFLVLTPDGTNIESVKSKDGIPVCCSCKYENDM